MLWFFTSFPVVEIGAGAAAVVVLIIVAVIIFICCKKRQQQQSAQRKPDNVIYIPVPEMPGGCYIGPPGAPVWQQDPPENEYAWVPWANLFPVLKG